MILREKNKNQHGIQLSNDSPNDSRLDHVLTVFINSLEDITRLSLNFSLDWQVQVNTDLLRLEA